MKKISLVLMSILLTGCSGLLTSNETIKYSYVLNPIENITGIERPAPVRLNIQKPIVPDWLNTQRIVLLRSPTQVDFYADTRWVEAPSDMLGQIISQSLINNNVAAEIFYANSQQSSAGYVLTTEVVAFDADYSKIGQAPTVHIQMQFRLMTPRGHTQHQFVVESYTPALENKLNAIIDAFEIGTQSCLEQLVQQVNQRIMRK